MNARKPLYFYPIAVVIIGGRERMRRRREITRAFFEVSRFVRKLQRNINYVYVFEEREKILSSAAILQIYRNGLYYACTENS